ncbi:MAG: hypothetical protein ACC628_26380 [Pirellulaceae bacterium]
MSNSTKPISRFHQPAVDLPAARPSPRELLDGAARAWDLSRPMLLAILLAPFFVAAGGVVAALMGKEAYKWVTEEDQFAETMQVFCYVAAWVLCLFVTWYHVKAKHRLIALLYVVLCFGLLFLIGEEVSWGQRFVGWGTPESLAAINKQNETNLHNIHGVGSKFKWIQLLVGAYGTILPIVFLRRGLLARHRELVDAVVPHLTLVPFFLPMFAWKLYRNLGPTPERFYYVITNYNEVIELILAMGFLLFMVFQWRKCRRELATRTATQ